MAYPRFRAALGFLALAFALLHASRAGASERPAGERPLTPLNARRIQALVDDFRGRLSIPQAVTVSLVDRNPLMASVEFDQGRKGAFVLSIERAFAESLTGDELNAVVAHELGHVWIFTHHPYLQTESLANHVAMRVVARERLEQVYEKVWQHGGQKGTIARFMGPSSSGPSQASGSAEPIRIAASPQQ